MFPLKKKLKLKEDEIIKIKRQLSFYNPHGLAPVILQDMMVHDLNSSLQILEKERDFIRDEILDKRNGILQKIVLAILFGTGGILATILTQYLLSKFGLK